MKVYHFGNEKGNEKRREKENGLKKYQIQLHEAHIMARNGLLALSISVGLDVLKAMMAGEAEEKAGIKGKHSKDRTIYRHGTEKSSVVMGGQKVKLERPRLRSKENREIGLEILEQFQSEDPLNFKMLQLMLMGITTRDYRECQDAAPGVEVFGSAKSSVSRRFVQESNKTMQEFMRRKLDDDSYPIILIDGVIFGEYNVIVALGVKATGEKSILGIREGSSENSVISKDLISDIISRGLKSDKNRLFVIDGSKALSRAVKESFGGRFEIQRCQLHKKRNVEGYLPETEKHRVINEMNDAYAEFEYKEAKQKLDKLAGSLEYKYPSAADSIREGLEETLTLHRLRIPGLLRVSLSTTNPIESAISMARGTTGRVRRWRNGNQVLRWLSCGFLSAEERFHKIKGYKLLPILTDILDGKEGTHVLEVV